MRWSKLFVPTLREAPADAEVPSHELLLRAGFIRQLGAGIYSLLPLAKRSLLKIERVVREEMERIGAQEFYLPALNPAEIWKQSGRWEVMGDNMFRLKDRAGRDLCLAMTHEEVFTTIARDEIRSYRNLPQIWYQIQIKFRDEPRPKAGLLRVRQFMMKDSYSFDMDPSGLDHSYELHYKAYQRIFDRCGIAYKIVGASSGAMGGSESEEFVVFSEAGEDWIVHCRACGYAANLECAQASLDKVDDLEVEGGPERVHTPGKKTIQEVSDFLSIPKSRQIKSLVMVSESGLQMIMLRGDHQLSEAKLASVLQTDSFRPGEDDQIRRALGASPGSLGPVGIGDIPLFADNALKDRQNLVCGANQDDYHLTGVTPEIDFRPEWADLREIQAGDSCAKCGGSLEVQKAIELGHIFKLGKRYSETMGAKVLGQDGRETHVFMGSYGIGIERILAAAAESYHDELGLIWPRAISPFQAIVTLLRPDDPAHRAAAEDFYSSLQTHMVDCLLDDRDERPGVKFKDAELIGIPVRITVGKKLASGQVELFDRSRRESITVEVEKAVEATMDMLDSYSL